MRATYLYVPLADVAALTAKREYDEALDAIWQDASSHKTYVTGAIGSIRFHEQFGGAYELPNLSAWNETCACTATSCGITACSFATGRAAIST